MIRRWLTRQVPEARVDDLAGLREQVEVLTSTLEQTTVALHQLTMERDAARREAAAYLPAAALGAAWCSRCAQLEQTCRALDDRLARAEGRPGQHALRRPAWETAPTTQIGVVR